MNIEKAAPCQPHTPVRDGSQCPWCEGREVLCNECGDRLCCGEEA